MWQLFEKQVFFYPSKHILDEKDTKNSQDFSIHKIVQ